MRNLGVPRYWKREARKADRHELPRCSEKGPDADESWPPQVRLRCCTNFSFIPHRLGRIFSTSFWDTGGRAQYHVCIWSFHSCISQRERIDMISATAVLRACTLVCLGLTLSTASTRIFSCANLTSFCLNQVVPGVLLLCNHWTETARDREMYCRPVIDRYHTLTGSSTS
jgi:hypothetical protein